MKKLLRLTLLALVISFIVTSWTACSSSDGLTNTGTTVYVSHGYGGYGPGWG
jgi:predicted MPP superfamily phosphohydrolase